MKRARKLTGQVLSIEHIRIIVRSLIEIYPDIETYGETYLDSICDFPSGALVSLNDANRVWVEDLPTKFKDTVDLCYPFLNSIKLQQF